MGSKVRADYRGHGRMFAGKITRARADGTFDILYDDGESEQRVPRSRIVSDGVPARGESPAGKVDRCDAIVLRVVVDVFRTGGRIQLRCFGAF